MWARKAAKPSRNDGKRHRDGDRAEGEEAVQRPHDTVDSGPTLWCVKCGAYAEDKAVKLTGECRGRPKRESGKSKWGGAWGQLNKLLNGKHPRTNEELPPPKRHDGTPWVPGKGKYLELKGAECEVTDDKFYRYVPEVLKVRQPIVTPAEGKHVQEKQQRMLERVRKREAEDTRANSVDIYVQERLASKLRRIPLHGEVVEKEAVVVSGGGGGCIKGGGHDSGSSGEVQRSTNEAAAGKGRAADEAAAASKKSFAGLLAKAGIVEKKVLGAKSSEPISDKAVQQGMKSQLETVSPSTRSMA